MSEAMHDRMVETLKRLEWCLYYGTACPVCEQTNPNSLQAQIWGSRYIGHKPDCELAVLIKEAEA
jgi:hypothetical protein